MTPEVIPETSKPKRVSPLAIVLCVISAVAIALAAVSAISTSVRVERVTSRRSILSLIHI